MGNGEYDGAASDPAFGLRQFPGRDRLRDESTSGKALLRLRVFLGANQPLAQAQHVRRRRLRRVHLDQLEPVEIGAIHPVRVDY